jgi:hypothetical protein
MKNYINTLLGTVAFITLSGVLFSASSAQAYVDDSPLGRQNYEQNYLTQLHFRTPGRDFLLNVDFLPDVYYESATYNNGVESSHTTRDRFPLSAEGTLGLTDLLSFSVGESYLFHSVQNTINETSGVQSSPATDGFSDPYFKLDYRYLGGLSGSSFGDGFVTLSPSVGDEQSAGSLQDGNNLRGGTTLEVGTDLYAVVSSNEFSFGGSWLYNASRNFDSGNPVADEVGDNYSTFNLRLRYRYHFNEFVFFQTQGTFYMPYSTHYGFYNSTNNKTEDDSYPIYIVPRLTLGGLLTNLFLLTGSLYYTNYTRSYTQSTVSAMNSYSSVNHEVTLDLGVALLF